MKILRVVAEGLDDQPLQVEHDVDDVFQYAGHCGELMSYTFNAHCTDCRTIERGKKNTSEGVAQGCSISLF